MERFPPIQRTARRKLTGVLQLAITLSLLLFGCNHSRYGVAYDRRLPELRRIAVAPAIIEVQSLHSGSLREARPDLVDAARDVTLDSFAEVFAKRKFEWVILRQPTSAPTTQNAAPQACALRDAVRDAILIHHYLFGNKRVFEYSIGDISRVALGSETADAVLWVYLTGVVPTEGRKALKTTAIVDGVLTGVWIGVSTNEAVIMLMLVDAKNGDVLWFDQLKDKADVREPKQVRRLVRAASSYLLKPRD
jgi:hypothetical protein